MPPLDDQTILLVEDDVKAREITTMILEAEGIHVYAAANARAAWELFGQHPDLDLVISDINMPGGMNGIQLTQRIRHDDPSMRVVLVSGNPQSSFSDLPEGILFLPKPFDRQALLGAVQASRRH
ncbi:response regulator [Rhodanobacter ginsengisoli]|uniref:Response regulator n=1 Tax=Rhodanobacter ginsengisoli TaxID=418646 RepID=A0ABW0QM72_9GAMM